nr:dihydropteroate synthase [Sinobacterium caligoides]
MSVLNVTPDSFSDGGRYAGSVVVALRQVERMLEAGADIIDVGGESTRPGAAVVSAEEELQRVAPVVEAIKQRFDVIVSVDTSTPEVMTAAAKVGAGMINDVRALSREGAMKAAASTGLPVCLMHMQGQPVAMQDNPRYQDVVDEVGQHLLARAEACVAAGIAQDRLLLDPGFGFGKTLEHNLQLFSSLETMAGWRYPLLIGVSRKSMVGGVTGKPVDERLAGSLAFAMLAAMQGAAIVRVHDTGETKDVLRVLGAVASRLKE